MSDFTRIKGYVPVRLDVTIQSGQSMSNAAELDGQLVGSIRLPNSANWTSANVTFMVSLDGGKTYGDLYKDGAEYVLTVPTGRTNATVFDVSPQDFSSITHIKVRSGTAGTPVNQGADRAIQIGRMP